MRKLIISLILAAIFSVPAWCQTTVVTALAQGSTTTVSIAWIADGSGDVSVAIDATTTGLDLTKPLYGMICVNAETVPGVPAPTDLYDIAITDVWGWDVFGGELVNRSATLAQVRSPAIGAGTGFVYGGCPIRNTWTVTISNAGAGGAGLLEIVFR
jgi:hypothetical protein